MLFCNMANNGELFAGVKDLFPKLMREYNPKLDKNTGYQSKSLIFITSRAMINTQDQTYLRETFDYVGQISAEIDKVELSAQKINALQLRCLSVSSPEESKRNSTELENILKSSQQSASKAKSKIESLRKMVVEDESDVEKRLRENQSKALTTRLFTAMENLNDSQESFANSAKNRIARQIQLVHPEKSEDEVMRLAEEGEAVVLQSMAAHTDVINAVADLQDRYRDTRRLEASIRELADLFRDMHLLVQEQGEMIDRIVIEVQSAKNHMELADKELTKAAIYLEKAKKNCCCLSIIMLIVCLIIGFPILIAML